MEQCTPVSKTEVMNIKACSSPCTLKVDGVMDQVMGKEAEFWGLFLLLSELGGRALLTNVTSLKDW
jgi:hypothetical protein